MGDCYLIAALQAIAVVNPVALRRLIEDKGDGTFQVSFYVYNDENNLAAGKKLVTYPITQRDLLGAGVIFSENFNPQRNAANQEEIWPALFEAAYFKYRSGKIRGGELDWALRHFTSSGKDDTFGDGPGWPHNDHDRDYLFPADVAMVKSDVEFRTDGKGSGVHQVEMKGFKPEDDANNMRVLTQIQHALTHKMPVIAASLSRSERHITRVCPGKFGREGDVAGPHVYAVQSVDLEHQTISLLNPWGQEHLPNFPIVLFVQCFRRYAIGEPL
jgi:hypothetical protein